MKTPRELARLAGLLYLVMSLLMIFGYMVVPARFIVMGDAAATARRITEGAPLYRLGLLSALISHILFLFVVLTLYRLFRDVDTTQARLMLVLVCVGVAAEIVNLANRVAPLVLLGGGEFLSAFSRAQLDALALTFLRLGIKMGQLLTALWGLWLFPFGILAIRSRCFPKVLGILLFAAGAAYAASSITSVAFPASRDVISRFLMPLYFAELPMVFWLLVKGAKAPGAAVPTLVISK